jgi:hypothetical protein
MMFEIRNYHYDPTKFDAYRTWAVDEAIPFLKANLDVVGFWIDNGESAELTGADPAPHKHGPANVTWIIRWDSMDARAKGHEEIFQGDAWQEIWSHHPDAGGYLQMEARFAEGV